jgi:hypothetical protein
VKVRVAAHVHSDWSDDGAWSLDAIARAFSRRGYHAVLMSEHDHGFTPSRWSAYRAACADASANGILLVPGIEYEDGDNVVHTPVWGDATPFLGASRPTLELLRAAANEGAVSVFAHPWRRDALSRYRPEWAPLLSAVEIWNRRYDGIAPHPEAMALIRQHALRPFVSLDFHTRRQFFPLSMSMRITDPLSASALVDAIRSGRCRPEVLGFSALRFTRGVEGALAQALETLRRQTASRIRALQAIAPSHLL